MSRVFNTEQRTQFCRGRISTTVSEWSAQPPDTGVRHGKNSENWKFTQFHRMPALSELPSANDAHGHLSCTIGLRSAHIRMRQV